MHDVHLLNDDGWTCHTCGQERTGYPSRDAANAGAEQHERDTFTSTD